MRDDEVTALLVFRGDDCVQRALKLNRGGGDFAGLGPRARAGLSRDEARFVVEVAKSGEPWTIVRLAPTAGATPQTPQTP